jgi:copper resistance protein C
MLATSPRFLLLAAAFVAASGATRPALAVGGLAPMEEEPNKGNVMMSAPIEVTMEFGADIDPKKSGFTVTDAHGHDVGVEGSKLSKTDPRMLTMGLHQPIPAGVYTVRWHATSPTGQRNHGSYTFTVQHGAAMHELDH